MGKQWVSPTEIPNSPVNSWGAVNNLGEGGGGELQPP